MNEKTHQMACPYCDEPVSELELRAQVYWHTEPKQRWAHYECSVRQTVGSVAHQLGKCSCYGGTEDDPEGMTKREAAKAALNLAKVLDFEERHNVRIRPKEFQ